MATFYNQANLTLGNTRIKSNITEAQIVSNVELTKTAVSSEYSLGDNLIYAVTLVNNGTTDKSNITLTDNLGAFTPDGGSELIPLTYDGGTVLYYQNGVLQPTPAVNAGPPLVISGIDIPAGGNVIVLYEVRVNEYAPLDEDATITNEVAARGCNLCDELTDEAEIPTRDAFDISIAKAVYPDSVSCNEEITYTFVIQNMGNVAVVATDNLIVEDTFEPALRDIVVRLNGSLLTEGVGYSYNEETGLFTTLGGAIPVPAATFERDGETGVVIATPGVAILTITGTI